VLLLLLLAVGGTGASDSATTAAAQRLRVSLYFLTDGQTAALAVRRTVVPRSSASLARVALQELLAGPNRRDRRQGLTSAIPARTEIQSFSIARGATGSTASVGLAGLPPVGTVSSLTIAQIGTQIARTIIGLSDIARVRIESNGQPWSFPLMSGGISTRPWDYRSLVGLSVGNFKALP
jgi:spore germination protein GerM